MKLINKGAVFEVIPEANGIIFSYPKSGDRTAADNSEEKIRVFYKYRNYVTDKTEMVRPDIYQLAKYGANYTKIVKNFANLVLPRTLLLPDSKVFVVDETGRAMLFDQNGDVEWTGAMKYKNKAPADIAVTPDGLWGAFPDFDALVRFNLKTMRNELRIGKKGEIFLKPVCLFAEGNNLYVSCQEGRRVIRFNTETFETETVCTSRETVYSYKKTKTGAVIILTSGLYEI